MEKLQGTITFLSKDGTEKNLAFVSKDKTEINIGSSPNFDVFIKSEDADLHCKIYIDSSQKVSILLLKRFLPLFFCRSYSYDKFQLQVKIKNISPKYPVQLNNEILEDKKVLKSGDIINVLNQNMRWETKAEAKRNILKYTHFVLC